MSPHVDDPFSGHMPEGDPRDLMWGCGGCTNPTIPAYNYLLASTNATGVLSFLNTSGIQLKPNTPFGSSWECSWVLNGGLPIVTLALLRKTFPVDEGKYRFHLQVTLLPGTFFSTTDFSPQSCNRTHQLTQAGLGFPVEIGNTGSDFKLLQVEWDQVRPPGGFP